MIYPLMAEAKERGEKLFAVLIDPDKIQEQHLDNLLLRSQQAKVDCFLIGGSILMSDRLEYCIDKIKRVSDIPTLLFPGNAFQVNRHADGILLLSLISGRNPELLIGQHVIAAPHIKRSGLEVIPTGYMLIDGGLPTSVSYMSNTTPIPANKLDIAQCTAMAGEMLGLKLIYMDAGSGAKSAIKEKMINAVSKTIDIPLLIGGGIRTPEKALASAKAGADMIVVGTAFEQDPSLLIEMVDAVHTSKAKTAKWIESHHK